MRTRFIVSLLMVIALALSIVSTVSADKGIQELEIHLIQVK